MKVLLVVSVLILGVECGPIPFNEDDGFHLFDVPSASFYRRRRSLTPEEAAPQQVAHLQPSGSKRSVAASVEVEARPERQQVATGEVADAHEDGPMQGMNVYEVGQGANTRSFKINSVQDLGAFKIIPFQDAGERPQDSDTLANEIKVGNGMLATGLLAELPGDAAEELFKVDKNTNKQPPHHSCKKGL